MASSRALTPPAGVASHRAFRIYEDPTGVKAGVKSQLSGKIWTLEDTDFAELADIGNDRFMQIGFADHTRAPRPLWGSMMIDLQTFSVISGIHSSETEKNAFERLCWDLALKGIRLK
jgi:hypothetical protein